MVEKEEMKINCGGDADKGKIERNISRCLLAFCLALLLPNFPLFVLFVQIMEDSESHL